jgi:hypothetical protein
MMAETRNEAYKALMGERENIDMKHSILKYTAAALLACASLGAPAIYGQDAIQSTTTTTTAGTVSDFGPQAIVVRSEGAAEPMPYSYTKSTTYVDENGNPVSIDTVKSGLPVTVYYTREGDDMVASKVVVRKIVTEQAPAPAPVVIEKTTTTTTTTTDK